MPETLQKPSPTATPTQVAKRREAERLQGELEQLCVTLGIGGRLPRHTELMRKFGASERSVLGTIEEMTRSGKLVRRHGSGTFVAELLDVAAPATPRIVTPTMSDKRTIVAVRVPDNSFFDRCMDMLFRRADAAGLSLVCQMVSPGTKPVIKVGSGADKPLGFLFFSYSLVDVAREVQEQGARAVIVGAPLLDAVPDIPCVYGDHIRGGYLATKHLIDLGHRHIVFLTGGSTFPRTLRWHGNQKALGEAKQRGLETTVSHLDIAEVETWLSAPEQAASYFRQPGAPTGVTAWNDAMACKLAVALNRAGVGIPSEVSIIGYDALPEGQMLHPQLTTVDHSIDWQLSTALDLLTRPHLPSPSHTVAVTPILLPRESTAGPRNDSLV